MFTRMLILALLLTLATSTLGQERIDLAVAETKPSNTQYRVERLTFQIDHPGTAGVDEGLVTVQLQGENGEAVSCTYTATSSPTATFLIVALNKANLSSVYASNPTTGSLKQRIFHRLAVMGEATAVCGKTLAGSLAGSVP